MSTPRVSFLRLVIKARRTTPFGHLLPIDRRALMRCAAREGVPPTEARKLIAFTAPKSTPATPIGE